MIEQAIGFAFLAALSPTALIVATVFLASADPRRTSLSFLFGALAITVVAGVIVFVALRAGGLAHAAEREPRYGLRLGLGALAFAAIPVVLRRKPSPVKAGQQPGVVSRLVARPAPRAAFAVGLLVFSPSLTFIAAVQVIATAEEGTALVALAAILVIVIAVLLAWVPLVLHLFTPDATNRKLKAIDGWLRQNGRAVAVAGLAVAGVALVVNGVAGLTS